LAQNLAGLMMRLFIDVGVVPDTTIQWIQTTGAFKTTYSSFMTQFYNRDGKIKPASRLNSTVAAISQILHENRDCCVVLDDIHPAESREIQEKNETTLEEITRRIGDSMGRNRMYGNKQMELSPNCTVVVTGEYEHGKGSTAARTLVTDYDDVIDSKELHKLQQEPLIVSTFYHYFLLWFLSNYDELKESLSNWLTYYRNTNLCEHKRLQETRFYLNASYAIFLHYCYNKEFLEEHDAQKLKDSFSKLLMDLVERQQERIKRHGEFKESPKPDYLSIIRSLFNNNNFSLPDMPLYYNEEKHDGIIKDDCLCLRRGRLETIIKKVIPLANITDVINDLKLKDALIIDNDGKNVVQKRAGGKKPRFYAIPLAKLDS
jgi:energy-converting hydrogenase A subunit M